MAEKISYTTINEKEERHLLNETATGSWDAFTSLYNVYSPLILHYLTIYLSEVHDVEEIGQEVFLKVWKRKESLPAIRSFKNYLFIITRNTLNDFLRARQLRLTQSAVYEKNFVLPHYSADEKLILDQYESLARSAISTLPEKQRRVFELRTKEEMTLQEIASKMGMSVGGVHKLLQQATIALKEYLGRHEIGLSLLFSILFLKN